LVRKNLKEDEDEGGIVDRGHRITGFLGRGLSDVSMVIRRMMTGEYSRRSDIQRIFRVSSQVNVEIVRDIIPNRRANIASGDRRLMIEKVW
jgi:hypothetical protein